MTVSKRSTPHRGQELINQLDRYCTVCTNRLNANDFKYTRGDVEVLQAHLRNAVYRLRFLELCVLGLTNSELNLAEKRGKMVKHRQAYADLDNHELVDKSS